ncbi:Serine/threonine-protein kinase PrkC [Thalassoglobus neptunius]|uniref:non-specific serine/threonine protein kinase n=1 Tax=Thalassoglobus neptunius TaxID=1938619 RepID=A0A5C5W0T8_9PLAN|nr:protein kinase [Thalassoglobus neptunius]TWT43601.1 Serine/threonine-protein kinase PrkC [Thalassoglobus neptunius]
MEPPSEQLVADLESLQLASRRDIAACRPAVRRASRGLPAFDSVWIHCLVATGKLTPFQAVRLETQTTDELKVGPSYVLADQIHFDAVLPVFRAIETTTGRSVVVTRMKVDREDLKEVRARFERRFAEFRKFTHPNLSLPTEYFIKADRGEVDIVSPGLDGQPMTQFLIRRGRVPEDVVRCIASQVALLMKTFPGEFFHGDLRLANVWLDRKGRVHLANPGIFTCLHPFPTIHSLAPKDAYDTMAPERISERSLPDLRSEAYSLGCILWQMLTGRPPHLVADPLAKLAEHQRTEIPDVREFAPDVSEDLARRIRMMTRRDPALRKLKLDELVQVAERGRQPKLERRLKRFVQTFETAAPRMMGERPASSRKKTVAAAVLLSVIACVVAWNWQHLGLGQVERLEASTIPSSVSLESSHSDDVAEADLDPELLDRDKSETASVPPIVVAEEASESADSTEETISNDIETLPQLDSDGLVRLTGVGPYRISNLTSESPIRIVGLANERSQIVVDRELNPVVTPHLVLQNVEFVFRNESSSSDGVAGITIRSDQLTCSSCLFRDETGDARQPLIRISAEDRSNLNAGRLLLTNCVFLTSKPVIQFQSPLTTARLENVFANTPTAFLSLSSGVVSGFRVPLIVEQSSFSGGGALVEFQSGSKTPPFGLLSIQGKNSVVEISPDGAIVEFVGSPDSLNAGQIAKQIELSGTGLIVRADRQLVRVQSNHGFAGEGNLEAELTVNGVLSGEFRFENIEAVTPCFPGEERVIFDALPVRDALTVPGFDSARFCSSHSEM